MRQPRTVRLLEEFGRTRLSQSFFMRDFLYSEIATINGFQNLPDNPDLAIAAGKHLCEELLEPLQRRFGRISVRSAYRSPQVNGFGNANKLNCATNEKNFAGHIWDRRDANGHMGATACVIVNRFIPYYERTGDWEALAWWIHDHLPYSDMEFFPKFAAFNLQWHEAPTRSIQSFIPPRRGRLTKPGMANWAGRHEAAYAEMLKEIG
ncbi:peptidase M15 [Devosia marina]|uniref:Peptidase M15 n=1 Tax=Devosia marina TaxID=2683198 RepID=A0A7X3FS36_9HYPH|nr:peptidase M15 [Devosia marina]MVS99631.1 peptidase M15 [Devosia marina]